MAKESSVEMEQLYTSMTQIYRTLETLNRSVQTWDDFLVFIAVQRLDPESVKAWEHHLGSSKKLPTRSQFNDFLMTRLLSLQAFEKSRMGKTVTLSYPNTVKSHFQSQVKDTHSHKPSTCYLCSSNHYITNCPQYNSKSVPQRLDIIKKLKLCYNCLGSHRASVCRITNRCLKCGHKHHTTIHQKVNSNTANSAATFETSHNTESKSSADDSSTSRSKSTDIHVLHSFIEETSFNSCLLATAQVVVISNNGETTKARALDQGSEISLISEHLVQVLHLPRIHSSISLIGVGSKKVHKSKGSTCFSIRSHFSSNMEISLSAHILPRLTTSLPSINIQKCH